MESTIAVNLLSMVLLVGLIVTGLVVFLVFRRSDGTTSRRAGPVAKMALGVLVLGVIALIVTLAMSSTLVRHERRTTIDIRSPGAEIFLGEERVASSTFSTELTGDESYCIRVALGSGIDAAVHRCLPTGSKVVEQRPRSTAASGQGLRGRVIEVDAERPGGVKDSFVLLAFEDPTADEIRAVAVRCLNPGHGAIQGVSSTPTARTRGSGFFLFRKHSSEVQLQIAVTLDPDSGDAKRWKPPRAETQ